MLERVLVKPSLATRKHSRSPEISGKTPEQGLKKFIKREEMKHLLSSIFKSSGDSFHCLYSMLFLFFDYDHILVETIFISWLHSVKQY